MKRYFCSLFDSGYLIKGLAMIESLKAHCPTAHVFVLCLDKETQTLISRFGYNYVTCITLEAVETEEVLNAKKTRGKAEYCWTLSPVLPSYILNQYPDIDLITYVDSDLLFFSSVQPIFDEIGSNSIAIIEHRFAPRLQAREINGRFCVEWVSFRRDDEGLRCLARWRAQCIEWCYYRLDEGRMGDQKYLDEWPSLYPHCHIIQNAGAGTAPWNFEANRYSVHDGTIMVNGEPVIFYHYHQFQMLDNGEFDRLSGFYTAVAREPEVIYATYEQSLADVLRRVRLLMPDFAAGLRPASNVRFRRLAQKYVPFALKEIFRRFRRY